MVPTSQDGVSVVNASYLCGHLGFAHIFVAVWIREALDSPSIVKEPKDESRYGSVRNGCFGIWVIRAVKLYERPHEYNFCKGR